MTNKPKIEQFDKILLRQNGKDEKFLVISSGYEGNLLSLLPLDPSADKTLTSLAFPLPEGATVEVIGKAKVGSLHGLLEEQQRERQEQNLVRQLAADALTTAQPPREKPSLNEARQQAIAALAKRRSQAAPDTQNEEEDAQLLLQLAQALCLALSRNKRLTIANSELKRKIEYLRRTRDE